MKNVFLGILVIVVCLACLGMALSNWVIFLVIALAGAGISLAFSHFKIKSFWIRLVVGLVVFGIVYFTFLFPMVDQWMTAHHPVMWQTLQMQWIHNDLEYGKAHAIAGNGIDAIDYRNAQMMDEAAAKKYDAATRQFMEKVKQGIEPSAADTAAYLAAQIKARKTRKTNQVLMSGGLLKSPTSDFGVEAYGNHIYLTVDVKNPEGATFEIPVGMTAEVSIDSAWYNCSFAEIAVFESSWCDANGYKIAPKKTRGNAEIVNRFLNPNELMGGALIRTDNNPWQRLAMDQTVIVIGSSITIAVNDWLGGWFGGPDGSLSASKEIQKGGFYDNRGYLRVLIVVKPKF